MGFHKGWYYQASSESFEENGRILWKAKKVQVKEIIIINEYV